MHAMEESVYLITTTYTIVSLELDTSALEIKSSVLARLEYHYSGNQFFKMQYICHSNN